MESRLEAIEDYETFSIPDPLVLVELEATLEAADNTLPHHPHCPSRDGGMCTCLRCAVAGLLQQLREYAIF